MQAMLINDFLDDGLAVEKMASTVEVNLHREKVKK